MGTEITRGKDPQSIDLWAVHPGGRTILDSAEKGLGLCPEALANSRAVLARFGNMSSATVMFVLEKIMQRAEPGQRGCDVVWAGRDGRDHALPCGLSGEFGWR